MHAAVAVAEIYKNHSSNINNNTRWEKSPRLGAPSLVNMSLKAFSCMKRHEKFFVDVIVKFQTFFSHKWNHLKNMNH